MSEIVHLFPSGRAAEASPLSLSEEREESAGRAETARAIGACLQSLRRDAEAHGLTLTVAALTVAIEAAASELL